MTSEFAEITVVGGDKTGIVANVTSALFERGINIEDIDQAVREGTFRMTLHADISEMVCTRETLRESLDDIAADLGVDVTVRFPSEEVARGLALLVTKESHPLEYILERRDELDAEIRVIVGNHSKLEGIADAHDVPFYDIGTESGKPDEERLLELLEEYEVDCIGLARYMRILSPDVVFRYEGRIINVHPSLLPAFPGAEPYRQALDAGVRIAGVTGHYVTTDLDQGPIIAQRAFDVPPDADRADLKARGQPVEAEVLFESLRLHLNDDIAVHRGKVEFRGDPEQYQLGLTPEARDANPNAPVDDALDVEDADPVEPNTDD
ncbi:formyltetrahydrofolate deformylase [Halarchaeum sp. CBA1220]|uniref:formyltetrahydrofolate deformylase n=1 Tax=Halarchaeum sp. CBA1220 TaxID=1853682 RepID=UPI000F3AA0A0|nr:formyltetrahydrofolate deformylase [Halarchaeum sp. CBA1220]QLC33060.1 formyltetrahydrofolate deformylase [Halarchaeum sp. CBA1220]